jgi:glucokinase
MSGVAVDLGGTHARFAGVRDGRPVDAWTVDADEAPSLEALLRAGLARVTGPTTAMALAIAAPVGAGTVTMTNRPWSFTPDALREALGLERLVVLNDFEAVAWAVAGLADGDAAPIGGARAPVAGAPRLVMGPGTGLGVSIAVPSAAGWVVVATEGGHATLAAHDDVEAAALDVLRASLGRVSAEAVLCGPGLLRLHGALHGGACPYPSPALLSAAAAAGEASARHTVRIFLRWLAAHAGDLALATGARGGVFLAGGVLAHLARWIDDDAFRAAFEAKAPMTRWLTDVPTHRLTLAEPGLVGAARALGAPHG